MVGVREAVEHLNLFQTITSGQQAGEIARPRRRMARNIMNTSRLQINQIFQRGIAYPATWRIEDYKVRIFLRKTPKEIGGRLAHCPDILESVRFGIGLKITRRRGMRFHADHPLETPAKRKSEQTCAGVKIKREIARFCIRHGFYKLRKKITGRLEKRPGAEPILELSHPVCKYRLAVQSRATPFQNHNRCYAIELLQKIIGQALRGIRFRISMQRNPHAIILIVRQQFNFGATTQSSKPPRLAKLPQDRVQPRGKNQAFFNGDKLMGLRRKEPQRGIAGFSRHHLQLRLVAIVPGIRLMDSNFAVPGNFPNSLQSFTNDVRLPAYLPFDIEMLIMAPAALPEITAWRSNALRSCFENPQRPRVHNTLCDADRLNFDALSRQNAWNQNSAALRVPEGFASVNEFLR